MRYEWQQIVAKDNKIRENTKIVSEKTAEKTFFSLFLAARFEFPVKFPSKYDTVEHSHTRLQYT